MDIGEVKDLAEIYSGSQIVGFLMRKVSSEYPNQSLKLRVIDYLMRAFSIPLAEAVEIQAWNGFGENGVLSSTELDKKLEFWLRKSSRDEA